MFHWQNLNDDDHGRPKGPPWHGRCWFGADDRRWQFEWNFRRPGFGLSFGRGRFHLACGLFSAWLSNDRRGRNRFSLDFHDRAVWLTVWGPGDEWIARDPWWRRGVSFHPLDFLLGRHAYSETVIETRDVLVPMSEGAYPATVKLYEARCKRPRSPFTRRLRRAEVDVPGGIPFEGKGENSWDCGEDAAYSLTTTARTAEEAVGKMVASVMEDRRRYGTPSRISPVMAGVNR